MTGTEMRQLVGLSVRDPASAARIVLAMNVPRGALWTGLFLVAVLNTILFSLSNMMMQGPTAMPVAFMSPTFYLAFVTGGLILSIYAIFWTGRWLGGTGTLDDIMAMMIWMQVLRVLVQVLALVLMLTVPILSALLVVAAAVLGLYIVLHFVNEAHRLGSLARAAGVLIAAVVAMVLALTVILALFGANLTGTTGNV